MMRPTNRRGHCLLLSSDSNSRELTATRGSSKWSAVLREKAAIALRLNGPLYVLLPIIMGAEKNSLNLNFMCDCVGVKL